MLVQNLHSYMDAEGKTPIQTIVARCYASMRWKSGGPAD